MASKQVKCLKSVLQAITPGKLESQPSSTSWLRVSLAGGMCDTPGSLSHSGCQSLPTTSALDQDCTHIKEPSFNLSSQLLPYRMFPCPAWPDLMNFFLFFFFLFKAAPAPYRRYMEVPRLGIESEMQLLAYTTATAMRDLSASVTYTTATLGP